MHLDIAVILPAGYRGGTLRGALNATRMLALGAAACGDHVTLSFGHLDDPSLYLDSDFEELRELGVRIRPFRPQVVSAASLASLYGEWVEVPERRRAPEYLVFNDGVSNFEDADFWLIISDRLNVALPAHRRYAIVVYDYIQRYVPAIFGQTADRTAIWMQFEAYAEAARRADFVVCTTQQTRSDCIGYVGADPERVRLFPMEFDPLSDDAAPPDADARPYLLWTTNSTHHKNHLNVLEGMERLFRRRPDLPHELKMSGVLTHLFDESSKGEPHFDDPYIKRVRAKIEECEAVKRRLRILGNIPDGSYVDQLARADVLVHGALYDNGTFSVVEAAWFGVPSVSSDYPAMREIESRFGVPLEYFEATDTDTRAAALARMLEAPDVARARLPGRERLRRHSFEATAPGYWSAFRDAVLDAQRPPA